MLKTIVHPSVKLVEFIVALKLALYQPQIKHLERLADALIVCDRRKTLTNLYREFVEELDPKTAADFFREIPWQAEDVGRPQRVYNLRLRQVLGDASPIVISIDDSLGKKYKDTRHLEAVAYHHDHNASSPYRQVYSNGYLYVESHVQMGLLGFTFDTQLYLREKTIRKLNRQRPPGKRLPFRSKYRIARAMLVEMAAILPKGYPVYVTFDSWYASAKLIKFCRRQGWPAKVGASSVRSSPIVCSTGKVSRNMTRPTSTGAIPGYGCALQTNPAVCVTSLAPCEVASPTSGVKSA